jgi:uncharacterized protein YdeI (YjbR/CyaY-like superfamily)
MGTRDKRVDEYIDKSADFSKPILNHVRDLIHQACPDVVETMKWSFPHFVYGKENICSMASFKQHCAFGFWKASLMSDPYKVLNPIGETAMGHMGQLKSVEDLPSDKIVTEYIREAMRLNDEGVKIQKTKPSEKRELVVPDYFMTALKKNKNALETFENFSHTNKKEYVEWVNEAKSEVTRNKRLETAVEWMSEGKIRHWKYMKK